MRNAGAEMLAAAVLTNLAYEEKGKEVLTAWEKPKIACVFVGMAKRGVTQAVRVLLNMSTHPPFRRKIAEEARSLKDLVAALEMGDKESVELLMGLMTNLSLDDDLAAGLVDAGAISGMTRPISTIDVSSPVGLTDQRIASLVARLARIPAGARAVRREGILDVVIVMIERAKTCKGDYAQGVTEACVRSIAQSVRADSECASALVDSPLGVISCLLGLLKDSGDAVVGNAALALQVVANDDKNIEALGKAGAVPVLLEVQFLVVSVFCVCARARACEFVCFYVSFFVHMCVHVCACVVKYLCICVSLFRMRLRVRVFAFILKSIYMLSGSVCIASAQVCYLCERRFRGLPQHSDISI